MGGGLGVFSRAPRPAQRGGWHVGSTPFWVALGLIALAGLWGNIISPVARHRHDLEQQSLTKEEQVKAAYQQELMLMERRDALKNDPVAIERQARLEGRVRAGKTPFVLPDNLPPAESPAPAPAVDLASVRRLVIFRVAAVIAAAFIIIQFIVLVDVGKK